MLLIAIKLGVSLVAILLLAAMAKWLKLGIEARIADAGQAIRLATEGLSGFEPVDAAVDRAGFGALVRDAANRHALIRAHGGHFVARMIKPPIEARLDQQFLTINLREPDMAPVTLNLGGAAQYWASGLRHIPHG